MKKTLFSLTLMAFAFSAHALDLTQAQKNAIRTDALSQSSISSCISTGNDGCVVDYYNSPSTKVVWKTSVEQSVIYNDPGFDWTLIDGLTVGKRDEWRMLFWNGSFDPSKTNQRAAIVDVWSGTSAKNAVQAAILAVSKRFATNLEALFATGTGTTATPALLVIEGQLPNSDIGNILRP